MFHSRRVVVALFACVAFAYPVRAAEIEWRPVGSTAPESTVVGNEIFIPSGGVEVTLEFFISGWAPELLRAYQTQVESPDYPDGTGMLEPACDPDIIVGPPKGECAFIDKGRTDYVFFGVAPGPVNLVAVDTSQLQYRWAAVTFNRADAVPDPGETRYGGTLIVEVAPDATGTLTVGFVSGFDPAGTPLTLLVNPLGELGEPITPLTLTPARITIGPPPAIVPTVSTWSVVVMGLLLLTGAKVYFSRRRATTG